jgi:hypothetical protein
VRADRNVEVHAVVDFIRLHLAQIPGDAGTAQHRAGEAERLGAIRIDTTPMPTVRCFQMRLSVSRVSYSST